MSPRGKKQDLALSIVFGALWLVVGALLYWLLWDRLSFLQRFALNVAALPLLWWAARYFAWYWRGRDSL